MLETNEQNLRLDNYNSKGNSELRASPVSITGTEGMIGRSMIEI